jgi:hypothetical protein
MRERGGRGGERSMCVCVQSNAHRLECVADVLVGEAVILGDRAMDEVGDAVDEDHHVLLLV